MDGIPFCQRAELNSSISTSMTGAEPVERAEGQFKARKTNRLFTSVRRSFENTGDRMMSGFSSFQKRVKAAQVKDAHWFNLLGSKDYVDSRISEQYYQENIQEFRKCYQKALQAYVDEKPGKHFSYIKGYLKEKSCQYSFRADEKGDGIKELLVTTPTMPDSFNAFSKELTLLLAGHGGSGSLARHLKSNFQSLGVKFDTIAGDTWLVRLKLPNLDEGASRKAQAEIACDGQTISSTGQPVKADSDEREKRLLVEKIVVLYETNEEHFGFCQLSKRIADLHKRYDQNWRQPSELPDFVSYQVARLAEDELAKLGKQALSAIERDLQSKNRLFLEYISLIWESFPSSQDQDGRQLIKFNQAYTPGQVVERALAILEEPEHRRFELVKLRLFRSRYEQEARDREGLLDSLQELKAAGDSLKGYKGYEGVVEKSPWFMNLVGECLRQGMPESLFKLGKITVSSEFRIIWKEKLIEWNIERSDKIYSKP